MQKKTDEPQPSQALGLTVYDLPDPLAAVEEDANRTRGGRWRMLWVLLVCAAPVIASYLTYYVFRPQSLRHFGELIQPMRAMPDVTGKSLDDKTVRLTDLKGQWLIVSVSSAECDALCQNNLLMQRQIRASLGREKERTDWVWLITDDKPVDLTLRAGLADAVVLRLPESAVTAWLTPAKDHALNEHLYLVDPHGDWMMRFPPHLRLDQAAALKRDWDKLLRASASWDKAGR